MLRALLVLAALSLSGSQRAPEPALAAAAPLNGDPAPDPTLAPGSLRFDRGEGRLALWVPPAEELTYDVQIDLGFVGDVGVGKVTLSSGHEPYRSGLPMPGSPSAPAGGKVGRLRSYAKGGHLGYRLEHELLTRVLPQDWPRILYQDTQRGSENRRRELKIGDTGEGPGSSYRHDGHCGGCDRREHFVSSALPWGSPHHCGGCKRGEHRVWRAAEERTLPEGTVDMLSAVHLARGYLREGRHSAAFPVLDKDEVWNITLSHGEKREVETACGTFACTEVKLVTTRPPEEREEGEFSGLFGIKGDLHIWMDTASGVPVLIQGDLPVGNIMTLGIDVRLEAYRGTPPAFLPVRK